MIMNINHFLYSTNTYKFNAENYRIITTFVSKMFQKTIGTIFVIIQSTNAFDYFDITSGLSLELAERWLLFLLASKSVLISNIMQKCYVPKASFFSSNISPELILSVEKFFFKLVTNKIPIHPILIVTLIVQTSATHCAWCRCQA